MAFFLSEIETGLHFVGGLEERIYTFKRQMPNFFSNIFFPTEK